MRQALLCVFGAVCMLSSTLAMAQNESEPNGPVQFVDMEAIIIDGDYKKPQVLYTDVRERVKFERLIKLKKSFLPQLRDTARDAALR